MLALICPPSTAHSTGRHLEDQIAEAVDPDVGGRLLAPEVEQKHAARWVQPDHDMNRKVSPRPL
jgi:hypothetical protein